MLITQLFNKGASDIYLFVYLFSCDEGWRDSRWAQQSPRNDQNNKSVLLTSEFWCLVNVFGSYMLCCVMLRWRALETLRMMSEDTSEPNWRIFSQSLSESLGECFNIFKPFCPKKLPTFILKLSCWDFSFFKYTYSFELVKNMLPAEHHKVLANIRKAEARSKRRKQAAEEHDDSESREEAPKAKSERYNAAPNRKLPSVFYRSSPETALLFSNPASKTS